MSKKEKKTIKIDKRLLVIISLSFLVLLGIGGYFLYEYLELKKPIDEKWGDTYYVYLKDIKNNKKKAGLPNKLNKAKVGFYKVKDVKDPIMVIEYEKDKETYSNIYYIENDKVNNIVYNEPTEIEFLYNIEEKEYNYYAHTKDKESDTYSNVSNKINKEDEKNYTFEKNEKDSVIDVNGKEISISKYDETFIEPKVKDNKESWDTFLKEQVLKDILKRLIKKCTPQEKIEKQVKKEVDKQVGDITKKQEEMKNAQAEVEKKKQEDEEK